MKYIVFFLLCTFPLIITAQIRGTVTDEQGQPVIGANIYWLETHEGTVTDADGRFMLDKREGENKLIISFIGHESDTLLIENNSSLPLNINLKENAVLDEVNIVGRKLGLTKMRATVFNTDMISQTELYRAACCNLGESFVTNPSVDVTYSDAATGAKQIRLLGLSGTYVQMLTENIPNFRGAASVYGLGYVPGPWMQSIQVSKGTSSVKNGYEAITGQINIEYKKPQMADIVSANLFAATSGRYEANADASVLLNENLSTMVFAHYENETGGHDEDQDGFMDYPAVVQYNLFNRWAYTKGRYLLLAGIRGLKEEREGGQKHTHNSENPYKIHIDTERYEGFLKNAYGISTRHNSSIALMLSGSIHKQDSYYGNKKYDLNQKNGYAALLYEMDFTPLHHLSTGLNINYDEFDQHYIITEKESLLQKETVSGMYAQYTFNKEERFTLMAGIRGDYSSKYGFFFTPRLHLKYAPHESVSFRASAGKGYRSDYVLAENNYLLASNRRIEIEEDLKQEEAWNYGVSASGYIPVGDKTLNINAEYYYTKFVEQLVIDMDSSPHEVHFTNLHGRSYAQNFQVDISYPFFRGFNLLAAYRLTDVKTTYGGILMEKPLTSRSKGLFTASYQTPLGIWQFDATLQLNGGGRMPTTYLLGEGDYSWSQRYKGYEQLSAQITRYFRHFSIYIGGENLTNFTQKRTIIGASDPWGENFDATMIWGPVHGIKGYVGIRFNLARH